MKIYLVAFQSRNKKFNYRYFFQELKQLCDNNYFLLMDNLLYIRTTLDKDSLYKNLRAKLFEDDSLLIQQVDFSDTTKIQGFLPLSFWSWFTQSENKLKE